MRAVVTILAALVLAIQYPLWFGKGGWLRVAELERNLSAQKNANADLLARNNAVAAEVQSLREGREAIEERARYDLNMLRDDELLFQYVGTKVDAPAAAATKPQ